MSARGLLIVFEGLDRCGKSTQVRKLAEHLTRVGVPNVSMRFPNRETPVGKIINEYLTNKAVKLEDRAIHLLFSANRWECSYAYSGVAFTAAKGVDVEWCKDPDRGLPAPDAVIYMQLSVPDASTRGDYGQERYEDPDFQKKVQTVFENHLKDNSWVFLDGRQSIDELHNSIKALVQSRLAQPDRPPVGSLWARS